MESGLIMNVFRKLLKNELGKKRYHSLVNFVKKYLGPEVKESRELYEALYVYCNGLDSDQIMSMQLRLNDVMYGSFFTGKTYSIVFVAYILAWFILLGMRLETEVLLGAIGVISIGFCCMTYQYFASRCAYADARIIETYRVVLARILALREGEQKC